MPNLLTVALLPIPQRRVSIQNYFMKKLQGSASIELAFFNSLIQYPVLLLTFQDFLEQFYKHSV